MAEKIIANEAVTEPTYELVENKLVEKTTKTVDEEIHHSLAEIDSDLEKNASRKEECVALSKGLDDEALRLNALRQKCIDMGAS